MAEDARYADFLELQRFDRDRVLILRDLYGEVAGLAAHGTTEIEQIHYIARGYDNIVAKLSKLGADIQEKPILEEDWRTSVG